MKITFLQTSDPYIYYPMLQETSKTIRKFCLMNGFNYEQYVGVKRGQMGWQASFNRIYMLKELLDRGVEGWAFYLDADAFIHDMHFDLTGYLADKAHYGAIFAGHMSEAYDVNSGGFAVNLSHPAGKGLILEYYRTFEAKLGADYDRAILWEHWLYEDQYLLYLILKRWFEDLDFGRAFLFEQNDSSHVNNGPFIKQFLRSLYSSFDERLEAIRKHVAAVLADAPPLHPERGAGTYLPAAHPRLQTSCGGKSGAEIHTTGAAGAFLRGPHARLDAGTYYVRIFGRAGSAIPPSDVVVQNGEAILSSSGARAHAAAGDVLVEHSFTLPETVHDLEIRMDVGAEHDLRVHGVQMIPARIAVDTPLAQQVGNRPSLQRAPSAS